MEYLIGYAVGVALALFLTVVAATYCGTAADDSKEIVLAAAFWPITLILALGIVVGEILKREKKKAK